MEETNHECGGVGCSHLVHISGRLTRDSVSSTDLCMTMSVDTLIGWKISGYIAGMGWSDPLSTAMKAP